MTQDLQRVNRKAQARFDMALSAPLNAGRMISVE